jgi:hypothetical protein
LTAYSFGVNRFPLGSSRKAVPLGIEPQSGSPWDRAAKRFKKFTEIDISFNCGVNNAGICELENLRIIKAFYNPKITNLVRSTA